MDSRTKSILFSRKSLIILTACAIATGWSISFLTDGDQRLVARTDEVIVLTVWPDKRMKRLRLSDGAAKSFLNHMLASTHRDDWVRFSQFAVIDIFCLDRSGNCIGAFHVRATYRTTGNSVLDHLVEAAELGKQIEKAEFDEILPRLKPWLRQKERVYLQ